MRPIRTPRTTVTYKLPGGTADNDLPAERVPLPGTEWFIQIPGEPGPRLVEGPGTVTLDVTDDGGKSTGKIEMTPQPTRSAVRTAWLLTDDEVTEIAHTSLIELTIFGEPIPPVGLAIIERGDLTDYGWGPENQQPEPPISREHANLAIGHLFVTLLEQAAKGPIDDLHPEQFLNHWHEALAATSRAALDAPDPANPDTRPAQKPTDPRQEATS
jgi:hypothetical protein